MFLLKKLNEICPQGDTDVLFHLNMRTNSLMRKKNEK